MCGAQFQFLDGGYLHHAPHPPTERFCKNSCRVFTDTYVSLRIFFQLRWTLALVFSFLSIGSCQRFLTFDLGRSVKLSLFSLMIYCKTKQKRCFDTIGKAKVQTQVWFMNEDRQLPEECWTFSWSFVNFGHWKAVLGHALFPHFQLLTHSASENKNQRPCTWAPVGKGGAEMSSVLAFDKTSVNLHHHSSKRGEKHWSVYHGWPGVYVTGNLVPCSACALFKLSFSTFSK